MQNNPVSQKGTKRCRVKSGTLRTEVGHRGQGAMGGEDLEADPTSTVEIRRECSHKIRARSHGQEQLRGGGQTV